MSDPTNKAVFLSYASQDAEAARRICEALRAAGVEVWFDQSELRGGDAWDAKIRKQIKECALFVPVISANTQARREGYFRLEWKLADDRTHLMARGTPFVLPVCVDDTKDAEALVPDSFVAVQWIRLRGGETGAAFCARVKHLLEGRDASPRRPESPAGDARHGRLGETPLPTNPAKWIGAGVALAVLAFLTVWRPWQRMETKPLAVAVPARPAAANEKSIVVLPFENLSPDPENAFFTDGVHEDVLTNLTYVRDLVVVPRITTMRYRGTKKSLREIGEELQVAKILTGSVRRAGQTVRVTGQLVDARTEAEVWTWQRDYQLTDVIAIQSALATAIAGELKAVLSPAEKKIIARRPTESVVAYDLLLKIRDANASITVRRAKFEELEAMGLKAVALDPNFAEAWAEIARARSGMYHFGFDQSPVMLAKVTEAIDTAYRLAPDSPEVLGIRGEILYRCQRDYGRALEHYDRVAKLQPNNPVVYQLIGVVQRRQGRWVEAIASSRKAVELDPRWSVGWLNLRHCYAFGHRWEEALAAGRRRYELDDTLTGALWIAVEEFRFTGSLRGLQNLRPRLRAERDPPDEANRLRLQAAIALGDNDEAIRLDPQSLSAAWVEAARGNLSAARERARAAIATVRQRLEAEPAHAALWAELGQLYALDGQAEEGLRCGHKAVTMSPESRDAIDGPTFSHDLAVTHAWLGDKDGAIAELARLVRVPGTQTDLNMPLSVHALRSDPRYLPLRGDPRFEALLNDPKNNAPLF